MEPPQPGAPGNVAALILAAGEGRRMGGTPKALLEIGGETFVARVVRSAREAGVGRIVVVRGAVAFAVPAGVDLVLNPHPERGMLSSIQTGLGALGAAAEAGGGPAAAAGALIWPVDCPRVPPAVVRALMAAGAAGAPVAIPRHRGRRGHPAFFAARLFAELLAAPLDAGARAVVRAHAAEVVEIEVDGPEVLDDVDTPEDHARVTGMRLSPGSGCSTMPEC